MRRRLQLAGIPDSTLRERLVQAGRTKWLDVGNGGNFEPGFRYVDVFPEALVPASYRPRYKRLDIVNASRDALSSLGRFDLVRMQHCFEHLTPEDGLRALQNVAALLDTSGYIVVTVPDLERHIAWYQSRGYRKTSFAGWATQRIEADAPDSFYFSVFAHSMLHEPHRWCYDFAGLRYQLERSGCFRDIQRMNFDDPLASRPFTHNRPDEDVCAIAVKQTIPK